MWKYYDESSRNMGVETSPYSVHGAKVETFYSTSSPKYANGDVSAKTVSDWDKSYDQRQPRFQTINVDSIVTSSSFVEHAPQYRQSRPAEMGIARKRLKLDDDSPDKVHQDNELFTGNQNLLNSDNESNTGKSCFVQPASFLNLHLDDETFNNLKKILETSEISAIKAGKPPDFEKQSIESEHEKQSGFQVESIESKAETAPELQQKSNQDAEKGIIGFGKVNFHTVQLDQSIWENLKKITESPVCLKHNDSSESNRSYDESLMSQSTKSEVLTDSLSQADSSILVLNKSSELSSSVCKDSVQGKGEPSGDPWFLNEKDTLNHVSNKTPGSVNRVRKSSLTCHTCGERGHSARFCTKVQKLPVCFICAREGHTGEFCRDIICSRCLHTGHPPERCRWFERENSLCFVCKFRGHYTQECSDFWRRYHLTHIPGHIVCPPHLMVTDRIFCYNCAEEGHLGHDCEEERIDPYSFPYYPFIVNYSIPHT